MSQVQKPPQQVGDKEKEKKKKETILDLSKYLDKPIRVKFSGGREAIQVNCRLHGICHYASFTCPASGILKGFDPLLNLVLDGTTEFLRDPDDPYRLTDDTRHLGIVVCRGTSVVLICPADGMEAIANPFVQQEG